MTVDHPFDKRKQRANEILNTNEYYKPMNITFESLADYKQCGGGSPIPANTNNRSLYDKRYFANADVNDVYVAIPNAYFKLCFGKALPPPVQATCLCGQTIIEQHYICPKQNPAPEKVIVVGSECIDKFSVMKGRLCEICGTQHFNRVFNLCNDHIKIKKKVSHRFTVLVKRLFKLYTHRCISSHVQQAIRLRKKWVQMIQANKNSRQSIVTKAVTSRINERKYMCDIKKAIFETFVNHLRGRQLMYRRLRDMTVSILQKPNKYTRKICRTLKSILKYKRYHEHQQNKLLMQHVFLRLKVNCMLIKKMFLIKKTRQALDNDIVRDMIYVRNVSTNVLGFGKHKCLTYQELVTTHNEYVSWVEKVDCPTCAMLDLQEYIRTFNRLKRNGYAYVG